GRDGPLRNGKPQGAPDLAAPPGQVPHRVKCPTGSSARWQALAGSSVGRRCGARTRSGFACRAPAMANGRCRVHGGTSTGPRTAAGLARLAAARTTKGTYSAENWARDRFVRSVARRLRLLLAARRLHAYLPPEFAARLAAGVPADLRAPARPAPGGKVEISTKTQGGGADAPGRCAAGGQPGLRGRAAELAAARA